MSLQSFSTATEKIDRVLERAGGVDAGVTIGAMSGGTDSAVANFMTAERGGEFGIELDVIAHANTGLGLPQTQLVGQIVAEMVGAKYIEGNNLTLADRVLKHGWPASTAEGHFYERIERKEDVFDKIHSSFKDDQLWISGARATESKKRKMNVPDNGVAEDSRRARQTWAAPLSGVLGEEKIDLIIEHGLPVSEAYRYIGISGECLGCAYDEPEVLGSIDILCPHLGYAIRVLTTLLYQRWKRGEIELAPKQLCWGWEPGPDYDEGQSTLETNVPEETFDPIGCNSAECGPVDTAEWFDRIPDWQVITLEDVHDWNNGKRESVVARFT